MKIGIMTFWQTNNNYGQIMQLFALQTMLIKFQHTPYLIRYYLNRKYKNSWLRTFKHLFEFSRYRLFLYWLFQKEPDRHFEDFRKRHLNITPDEYRTIEELSENMNMDAYIVGSDQVWNYSLFGDSPDSAFFLQFAKPGCRKIAYAPSFGMEELPSPFEDRIRGWLKTFSAVSVRDEASWNICRNQLGIPAEKVTDPTMLLDAKEYESLFEGDIPTDRYCVFYHLAAENNIKMKKVRMFCKKNGLKFVYIPVNKNGCPEAVYPTIGNWLKYMANADFVITNSFHGTIFSMLFQRKFVTLLKTGSLAKRNVRITSLLADFHASNRIIDLSTADLDAFYRADAFSFDQSGLDRIRQSREFLEKCLK